MNQQPLITACRYCQAQFTPKRERQEFCRPTCRQAFHQDVGAAGSVARVQRIRRGASLVIHLEGPAAERALAFEIGSTVRVVR